MIEKRWLRYHRTWKPAQVPCQSNLGPRTQASAKTTSWPGDPEKKQVVMRPACLSRTHKPVGGYMGDNMDQDQTGNLSRGYNSINICDVLSLPSLRGKQTGKRTRKKENVPSLILGCGGDLYKYLASTHTELSVSAFSLPTLHNSSIYSLSVITLCTGSFDFNHTVRLKSSTSHPCHRHFCCTGIPHVFQPRPGCVQLWLWQFSFHEPRILT